VLHTRLTDEESEKLRSEARLMARLAHSHIIRVLEFGVEDSTPFLIMEYASQGMVRNRSPKGSIVPLQTATSYVKQIAEALQYARDRNLIHRCFHRYVFAVSKMDKNLEEVWNCVRSKNFCKGRIRLWIGQF
jgi:hypothetical protein